MEGLDSVVTTVGKMQNWGLSSFLILTCLILLYVIREISKSKKEAAAASAKSILELTQKNEQTMRETYSMLAEVSSSFPLMTQELRTLSTRIDSLERKVDVCNIQRRTDNH